MKLKELIKETARRVVREVEIDEVTAKGAEKKRIALELLRESLPFPGLVNNLICLILNEFIDEVIERAVVLMKREIAGE